MAKRYWEAGKPPAALLDWVSENVVSAIKDFWEIEKPAISVELDESGRLTVVICGPGKPTDSDPDGIRENYEPQFDLLDALASFSVPFDDPQNQEELDDLRKRAAALRQLAEDATRMAAHIDGLLD